MAIPTEAGNWGGKRRSHYNKSQQSLKVAEMLVASTLNLCCTNGSMAKNQKWLKTLFYFISKLSHDLISSMCSGQLAQLVRGQCS